MDSVIATQNPYEDEHIYEERRTAMGISYMPSHQFSNSGITIPVGGGFMVERRSRQRRAIGSQNEADLQRKYQRIKANHY